MRFAASYRRFSPHNLLSRRTTVMCSKLCSIAVLIIFFGLMNYGPSRLSVEAAELLSDAQNPLFLTDDFPVPLPMMKPAIQNNLGDDEVNTPCHIEYQITRKRIGRCMKLARGVTGCVSGQYLNPFDPDCL